MNEPLTGREPIEIEGARTHNLRDVSCTMPRNAITVVTGVSGSGKSSLAFDTLYAEGQRRYVETLSTYARQFLQQMQKPPVKAVRHVPPALALRQGNSVSNARSTVSGVTELHDHLALLFAGAGQVVCRNCGAHVVAYSPARVVAWLREHAPDERIVVIGTSELGAREQMPVLLLQLAADGHRRLWVDGEMIDIDAPEAADLVDVSAVRVVIDRLKVDDSLRVIEAVEAGLNFGEPWVDVLMWDRRTDEGIPEQRFYTGFRCSSCHTPHHAPIPALFNTNSHVGACSACEGYGRTVGVAESKVVPDPRISLESGAVQPFESSSYRSWKRRMLEACMHEGVPIDIPWRRMDDEAQRFVMRGGAGWPGVHGFFEKLGEDRYKPHIRILIARYRDYTRCARCDGSGLSDDARAVRIDGRSLADISRLRIERARAWIGALDLDHDRAEALSHLVEEIASRLAFLDEAGVGYLTLDRAARTLSGGEMHRVLLATSVGRMLTDTCYVLDEPTAGLHAHDTERLFHLVERLRDIGNTVVVVEHDPDVIARADWIVELGPAGGDAGGLLQYEGDLAGLRLATHTATGAMLARRARRPEPVALPGADELVLRGACLNNLQDVEVRFPKGALSVVTGVSGSGKSSLVVDVLCGLLEQRRSGRSSKALGGATLDGDDFAELVVVDQDSLARSSRSCSLTQSGAYTPVRELFAASDAARLKGMTAGTFSYNTPGGRCDRCEGTGVITIEMHFIADIELTCDVCGGRRFKPEVLAVTFDGMTIADVFDMTIDEALRAFVDHQRVARRLQPLQDVGLGYLRLGQATSKLSGGELQRLKLASYVGAADRTGDRRLFVFDEPTVGLHLRDVEVLLGAIRSLTDAGHTVIVVEHNLDFVAQADHVVDLGPGAGPDGGQVMYQGPVPGLADVDASLTGRHLAAMWQGADVA